MKLAVLPVLQKVLFVEHFLPVCWQNHILSKNLYLTQQSSIVYN